MKKDKDLDRIAQKINDSFELDIFKNTRERAYVDARSVFCYIAKYYYGLTYHQIEDYFKARKKSFDHSTAVHAIKMFEVVLKFNKQAGRTVNSILGDVDDRKHIESVFDDITRHIDADNIDFVKEEVNSLLSKITPNDQPRDIRDIKVEAMEVRQNS